MQSPLEQNAITEAARRISPLQEHLLRSLREKGPGLLLEMAVRVHLFPEDVRDPLTELVGLSLVTTQSVSTTKFGAELFLLAPAGDKVLALLASPTFRKEGAEPRSAAASRSLPPPDTRQSEAELHRKLGDALQQKGDFDEAIKHYQKALDLTRELSAGPGTNL